MAVYTNAGGGGGTSSDELTATRGDVLKGVTAVTLDSNDEAIEGTLELTGDAADSHVLEGKTYYNKDAKIRRMGAMPNRGATGQTLNAGQSYTIPAGYHNGGGTVTANGLAGQTAGTAVAGDIYPGKTAWVNGGHVTGAMPLGYGGTYTPQAYAQTVYCDGARMIGNIVINPIPGNFVDVNVNQDLFRNGSYGPMAVGAAKLHNVGSGNSNTLARFVGVAEWKMRWTFGCVQAGYVPSSGKVIVGSSGTYFCETVWFKKKINLTNYRTLEIKMSIGNQESLRVSPVIYLVQAPPTAEPQHATRIQPVKCSNDSQVPNGYALKDWSNYVNVGGASGAEYYGIVRFDVSSYTGWWYMGFKVFQLQYGSSYKFIPFGTPFYIDYATLLITAP